MEDEPQACVSFSVFPASTGAWRLDVTLRTTDQHLVEKVRKLVASGITTGGKAFQVDRLVDLVLKIKRQGATVMRIEHVLHAVWRWQAG